MVGLKVIFVNKRGPRYVLIINGSLVYSISDKQTGGSAEIIMTTEIYLQRANNDTPVNSLPSG